MTRQQTWFTKQLETAAQEAKCLPSWARQEAGLKALAPAEPSTSGSNAGSQHMPMETQNTTPATDK